jgi:hypothetical protein
MDRRATNWIIGIVAILFIVFCVYWFEDEITGYPAPWQSIPSGSAIGQNDPQLRKDSNALIGTWQSTQDANYTLIIDPGGTTMERYAGDSSSDATGTISLFTSANPDIDFQGDVAPDVVYVKISNADLTRYFSIVEATNDSLKLTYLDRGNELDFTRVR